MNMKSVTGNDATMAMRSPASDEAARGQAAMAEEDAGEERRSTAIE